MTNKNTPVGNKTKFVHFTDEDMPTSSASKLKLDINNMINIID